MKRAALLAIPLLVGAVLVARGGGTTSALAAVTKAADRTADATSSRFTVTWHSPAFPQHPEYDFDVQGVMDYRRHRGQIHYWGDSEVIYDGDVTYMKWSMPWRKESPWLQYDAGVDEPDPLDLKDRALRNPLGLLRFLKGASPDVREIGGELVRGVPTIHYDGTLDLQRVVDQAPAAQRAKLQELLDFIREDEPSTVPFALWVDDNDVAHRLRVDQGESAYTVIEYYDFGTAVAITPPQPSDIMSFEDFMREMKAHANDSSCSKEEGSAPEDSGRDDEGNTIGGGTATMCFSSVELDGA